MTPQDFWDYVLDSAWIMFEINQGTVYSVRKYNGGYH